MRWVLIAVLSFLGCHKRQSLFGLGRTGFMLIVCPWWEDPSRSGGGASKYSVGKWWFDIMTLS